MIGEPVLTLYLDGSLESRRLRALSIAKQIETKIVDVSAATREFDDINPDRIYPFLVSKDVMLHGPSIDEYINERFPVPMLLPPEPRERAITRFLSDMIRSWYKLADNAVHLGPAKAKHIAEVEKSYEPSSFWLVCERETIVDVSMIVFLNELHTRGLWDARYSKLRMYYEALVNRYELVKNAQPKRPAFTELEERDEDEDDVAM